MRSHVTLVCLSLLTASAAHAGTKMEEPVANSGPAKSVARDIDYLVGSLQEYCLKDDPAKWEREIAEYEGKIAKFTDAEDKANWTKYMTYLRSIYKARLDGEPNLGTYAEIKAKHAALSSALDTKPAATELPADPAAAKQLAEKIAAYRAKVEETITFAKKVRDGTRCEAKHIGDWYALGKRADSEKSEVTNLVSSLLDKDARALSAWASNLPQGSRNEPAKDWWGHIQYAGGILEAVGKAQRFQAKVDALLVLAPLAGESDVRMISQNATTLKEYMTKNAGLAKQLIGEIMVPKAPGGAKETAELKKLIATYKDGKLVGTTSAQKPNTATFEEWEGGRKYQVVKKKYSGYYVWKPSKPSENTPTIEGVAADDICELWSTNLVLYVKGGPSHAPFNKWRGDQSVLQGYMLCSNKDKKSPKPYKD